jgi:hypothetical protein
MMCGETERTSVYELCLAIGTFTFNGSWVWRTNDVTIWAHNNCTVRKGCREKQKYTFMKVKISSFPSRVLVLAWLIHSGYNAVSNCGMFVWKKASLTRLWPISRHNAAIFLQIFTAHHEKLRSGYPVFGLNSNAGSPKKRNIRLLHHVTFTFNRP